MRTAPLVLPLLIGLTLSLSACASSPEQLAADLQKAFEGGDMDAALALAKIEEAPADLHFFYLDQVHECAGAETVCTATIAPLDDEIKAQFAEQATEGLESAVAPEGLVVIASKASDGSGSGKMRVPYAKVDGRYRLITPRYSAAKLAELRATTNEALLEKMLAGGIYDTASGERRTDWKDTASALPANGGEPGAALKQRSVAFAAAVKAGDPDLAMRSGDPWAERVFSDKSYDGKPITLPARKLKLRAQAARFLHDVEVTGGWLRGDEAILLVDAKNGVGWIERGAIFMSKDESGWGVGGKTLVSYPAP